MILDFDITDNIKNMSSRLLVWASLGIMNVVPWIDMNVFNEELKGAVNALLFIIGWVISMFIAISTIMKRRAERRKIEAETEALRKKTQLESEAIREKSRIENEAYAKKLKAENDKIHAEAREQILFAEVVSATNIMKQKIEAIGDEAIQKEFLDKFGESKDVWIKALNEINKKDVQAD